MRPTIKDGRLSHETRRDATDVPSTRGYERDRAAPELTHEEPLPHENLFWRRAARWGSLGPEWWLKYGPPVFGWAAALCVPSARRAVQRNLRRIRGPASPLRDARDVLSTFGTYASCVAEVLSNDGDEGPKKPHALVAGERYVREVVRERKGESSPS